MKKIQLKKVNHNIKIGDICEPKEPNIKEDCLFYEGEKIVGFFLKDLPKYSKKLNNFISIADKEFRSKNVPKSSMNRTSGEQGQTEKVQQYSTIIGATPPRPHMRRPYPSMSSVHNEPKAKTFIKAMLLALREGEKIIKEIIPEQYEFQKKCIEENVPKEFRLGNLFTSSISNYNISAPFHRDNANLKNCVNLIITKKQGAKGGNLHVPDYDATMDSADNSMLVYPAWKNVHGVTPIEPLIKGGYRNSLIFYPLKSFKKYVKKV